MSYKIMTIDSSNFNQESYFTDKKSFDKAIKHFSDKYWFVAGYEKINDDWKPVICFHDYQPYPIISLT